MTNTVNEYFERQSRKHISRLWSDVSKQISNQKPTRGRPPPRLRALS